MIFDVALIPNSMDILEVSNATQSDDLLQIAFITAAIEVSIFYLCGYRNIKDCIYFVAVNIISNLLLNEFLHQVNVYDIWVVVIICEIFVVMLEFALCSYWIETDRKRLLKVLIFTNLISFLCGIIFYILF